MERHITALRSGMQSGLRAGVAGALRLLFPPQCLGCDAGVTQDFALCAECWRETGFISGLVCDACGAPLPGMDEGRAEYCDACLAEAPPWGRGRAALVYQGTGRRLVLALKHGDRQDLAAPMARWMAAAAAPVILPGMLVAPVPLHWRRFLRRRFNQSALLSAHVARLAGLDHCPDLFQRPRATPSQEGRDRAARIANVEGAIRLHPRRAERLRGRAVLIVDDVMTSGATLAAATRAAQAGGATEVRVLALARVAKDG